MGPRSERDALREDAARLLDELGGSADQVACSLYRIGETRPHSSSAALSAARYLHAVVGADSRVETVTVTKRWLVMKTRGRWRSTVRVRLPRPVQQFTSAVNRIRSREGTGLPLEDEQA